MTKNVTLGGEERPVKYTTNALIEFEELTGLSIIGEGIKELTKPKFMRALVFVGLKHGFRAEKKGETVPFTLEDVGDWINFNDSAAFLEIFSGDTAPDPSDKEEAVAEETKN